MNPRATPEKPSGLHTATPNVFNPNQTWPAQTIPIAGGAQALCPYGHLPGGHLQAIAYRAIDNPIALETPTPSRPPVAGWPMRVTGPYSKKQLTYVLKYDIL